MVNPRRSLGGALLGVLLGATPAASQDAQPTAASPEPVPSQVGYQGVVPGSGQPPAVVDKPGSSNTMITWPGFQMLPEGGSRIFVQATGPLSTGIQTGESRIIIDLGPAKLATQTNGLMLETRFFNTPVKRAFVRRKSGSAQLVLEMRAQVHPRVTTEQVGTGFHFVYVDFPAGQFLAEVAPTVAAAPEAPPEPTARPVAAGGGGVVVMPTSVPTHLDNTQRDAAAKAKLKASASGKASASAGDGKAKAEAKGTIKLGL